MNVQNEYELRTGRQICMRRVDINAEDAEKEVYRQLSQKELGRSVHMNTPETQTLNPKP